MEEFIRVFESVLPRSLRKPSSPSENAIEQRHIMIYGGPGSGKTNAFRHMAECLRALYGPGVYVAWSDGDLAELLGKLDGESEVQLLCCEDMTRIRQPEEAIHGYFTIRHLMAERTGRRYGLVVTAFTTHDLFGIQPKSLRTNVDLTLFLETPSNPYDERIARETLGEEVYEQLRRVEGLRREKPEFMGVAAYATKWRKGLTFIPKSEGVVEERRRQGDFFLRLVLEAIWGGATDMAGLQVAFPSVHPDALKEALARLEEEGLIRQDGLLRKKWRLTLAGAELAAQRAKKNGKIFKR